MRSLRTLELAFVSCAHVGLGPAPDDGADQLVLPGPGPSVRESSSRHSSALPLLKKYMIQFLKTRLQSDRSELFSIPLRPGVLKTLQECLRPGPGTDFQLSLPRFDVDLADMPAHLNAFAEADGVVDAAQFGQAVQHVLFFHVVRVSPNSMVRAAVEGETGFDAADIIVAPHRALHVQGRKRQVIVDSVALEWLSQEQKQPFVLSLSSFSCEELTSVCKWTADTKLVLGFWGSGSAQRLQLSASASEILPALLEEVLPSTAGNGYKLDVRDPAFEEKRVCLRALNDCGLARNLGDDGRYSTWCLTENGIASCKTGYQLSSPSYALEMRNDVELAERTVWELMLLLDRNGWQHMVKDKGQDDPYRHDAGNKIWYSKPGEDTVSHGYLLCLAKDLPEVPHWQAAGFYQSLASGQAPARRVRKIAKAIRNVDEDDWEVGALADVQPSVKRPRQAQRQVRAAAIAAVADEAACDEEPFQDEALALHAEVSSDSGFDVHDEQDAEVAAAVGCASSGNEEGGLLDEAAVGDLSPASRSWGERTPPSPDPPQSSESSQSGSSESSSSSSSSSSASAPPESARRGAAKGKAKAKPRASNPKASFYYGLGHAVRTYAHGEPQGWEMSCSHPCHVDKKCRKNLKSVTRSRTAEQSLQMLKVWIVRGRHCLNAEEHMSDVWSEVQRDAALQQLEDAPEDPPMHYTAADGTVKIFER